MKRVGQIFRENLVDQIKGGIDKNTAVFVLNYSNLASPTLSNLRKNLSETGAEVIVSKNSLARVALEDLKQNKLAERLVGQTAFVWSSTDSVAISKILVKFAKECETFKVQGGLLEGRLLESDDIAKLSELPSREVLLANLLGTIQAPLTRLACALNAKSRDLLSILKQLSEKKGGN